MKLPKAAESVHEKKTALRTCSSQGQILVRVAFQVMESTVLELIFKNIGRAAPRHGLVSHDNFGNLI